MGNDYEQIRNRERKRQRLTELLKRRKWVTTDDTWFLKDADVLYLDDIGIFYFHHAIRVGGLALDSLKHIPTKQPVIHFKFQDVKCHI